MTPSALQRLRASLGDYAKDMSDSELIYEAADASGQDPVQVAQALGVKTGKDRNAIAAGLSSGVDDVQGLGYSAGAAVADALGFTGARDSLNRRSSINQMESRLNGRPDLERIEDVYDQPGKWLPYAGYQVAKQIPNLAASVAAGLAVPEAAVPAALARAGAALPRFLGGGSFGAAEGYAAQKAAVEAGRAFGRQALGGGAVNYAQGVGSLYQEAVEGGNPEAGLSALAGGVPYAITETLPENMLLGRIKHGSGFSGNLLTRVGKAAGSQAVTGATSELLQNEMEMAYNGHVSDEQALSRRLNSGVAGGLVEGLLGSFGGVRRSRTPGRTEDGALDLVNQDQGDPLQLGYSPLAGTPVVFPDGTVALNGEQELQARFPNYPEPVRGVNTARVGEVSDPNVVVDPAGTAATNFDDAQAMTEPGAELGRQRWLQLREQQARIEELKRQAAQKRADIEAQESAAAEFGLKGDKAVGLFTELKGLLDGGAVTDAQFAENVGLLQARKMGSVRKWIDAITDPTNPMTNGANAAPATQGATNAGNPNAATTVPAGGSGQLGPVAAGSGQAAGQPAARTGGRTDSGRADGVAAPGGAPVAVQHGGGDADAVAGIDPSKTVTVGRSGRGKALTAAQVADKISGKFNGDPVMRERILLATGWTVDEDPDTGAPIMTESEAPMPFAEIARRQGVSRQAVEQSLKALGISESVALSGATNVDTVASSELGLDNLEPGDAKGFREADTLGEAAGAGRFEGETRTRAQAQAEREADRMVAENGMEGGGSTDMAIRSPDTVVTDLREQNADKIAANIQRALADPEAPLAASDWASFADDTNLASQEAGSGIVVAASWEELPDNLKADWIVFYVSEVAGGFDEKALAAEQVRIERKFREYQTFKKPGEGARAVESGQPAPGEGVERAARTPGAAEHHSRHRADDQNVTDVAHRDVSGEQPATEGPGTQGVKFSKDSNARGSTRARVLTELAKLGLPLNSRVVTVVQSIGELPADAQQSLADEGPDGKRVQGFVLNGRVYMIADNIQPGMARAAFLHEAGAHLGLEDILSGRELARLAGRIRQWAEANDGSLESQIALRAMARVENAGTHEDQHLSERIAYFVEEAVKAGVDPTAAQYRSELGRWMQSLVSALKAGLRKLGVRGAVDLTAQDVVDMAYGAAHLAMREDLRGGSGEVQASTADNREPGASPEDTPEQVLRYYVRTDKGKELKDGTGIDSNSPHYSGPGTEHVTWPPDNAVGRVRNVETIGVAYVDGRGLGRGDAHEARTDAASIFVYTREIRQLSRELNEPANGFLLHISAERKQDGVWAVAMNTAPVDSEVFKELEGRGIVRRAVDRRAGGVSSRYGSVVDVTPDQRDALLAEARRRLTRMLGGQVPSVRWVRETGANTGKRGALTPEQVRAKFSIAANTPEPLKKAGVEVGSLFKDASSWATRTLAFTKDLAAMAAKLMPSAADYIRLVDEAAVNKARQERKVQQIVEQYRTLAAHERGFGPGSVNAFLRDSTMGKKWGFKPEYHSDVAVDQEMAARFQRLSAPARKLVQDVFRHGHETLQDMKSAVLDSITSEYDAQIAAAKAAGDEKEVADLTARKGKSLRDYQSLVTLKGDWPYAPLKRFGDFVVVARSKAYLDAEKAGDGAKMREMQANGDHYHVEFAETRREARAAAERLAPLFGEGASVEPFAKDQNLESLYGGRDVMGAFHRLRNLAEDATDAGVKAATSRAVHRLLNDLHFTLLGEQSARNAERNRVGVAGADKDMMRAFATQGIATAHFIASLRNNGQVQDKLRDMRREADSTTSPGTRMERRDLYNELAKRHAMGLEYRPAPIAEKVMSGTSMWMLLTSPAYYVQNMVQPWVMSLPMLAGRHGYAKSASALYTAYRDIAPLLKDGKFTEDDYAKLPADVRKLVERLADGGFINISMALELGRWRSDEDSHLKHVGTVVDKLRSVSETVESVNRLATAVAALRLERAKGAGEEKQVEYAGRVIYDTHGDYSGFNAPAVMRTPTMRVVTQFRKFQLIQLSMFTKLLHDSFKGASSGERFVARKVLAFNLAHMLALGGIMGLPGFTAIAWVLGFLGDDDEPDNPELTLRRLIGDPDTADLLVRGVPKLAGVDLSGRLGAAGMLSLLPRSDLEVSRKGWESIVTSAMGPFIGGVMPNVMDGLNYISKGDYYKGLEQIMPAGIANAMKGARISTEGFTQRNGDVTLRPDEVSVLDGMMQALGLPTNTLTDRGFAASSKFKADKFFAERTPDVKKAYTEAYRSGDAEKMAEARQEWMDLQASRVRNGYTRQPLSELMRAPMEQAKRERSAKAGVTATRYNKGFVGELEGLVR